MYGVMEKISMFLHTIFLSGHSWLKIVVFGICGLEFGAYDTFLAQIVGLY